MQIANHHHDRTNLIEAAERAIDEASRRVSVAIAMREFACAGCCDLAERAKEFLEGETRKPDR